MMEETKAAYARMREYYGKLDEPDQALFWVHFVVAPALIFIGTVMAFGWAAIVFWAGVLFWIGSNA